MGALANIKWEKFALGVAQDMPAARAYVAAGYTAAGHSVDANASRLLKRAEVSARIAELQEARVEHTVDAEALSRLWVLDRLMRNAKIAMGEEKVKLTVKPRGQDATVDLEVTMRDASAANKALEMLGREVGLFVEKTESTITHKHEDRVKRREEILAKRREERANGSSAPMH